MAGEESGVVIATVITALAGFTINIIGMNYLDVWFYNNTGSIFLAIILHAFNNVFPTILLSSEPLPATVSEPILTPRPTPLSAETNHLNFSNILIVELILLLKGQRWWWYLVAGGFMFAGLFNSPETAYEVISPMTWVRLMLLWSSIGCRETRHNVQSITFALASQGKASPLLLYWRHWCL